MGKTIIQPIGPLYGEPVNGTVYGRPNGSIYIPASNMIRYETLIDDTYICNYLTSNYFCDSTGNRSKTGIRAIAESQDIASYMRVDISEDSDFSSYGSRLCDAGNFNFYISKCVSSNLNPITIVADQTYYARVVLVSSTGVDVAVSDVLEVTGYVSE